MDVIKKPFVVAISGVKNSGKTTFLEYVIPIIKENGFKVGVIKHDGHEFVPDVLGTDSHRLRTAGATGVAVYSKGRWMVIEESPKALEDLVSHFSSYDIILLEGEKTSPYPKIELVRKGVSEVSVCQKETLLALATDTSLRIEGVVHICLSDYKSGANLIMEAYKKLFL